MSKQKLRKLNEEDEKALGEFITTCFDLNDQFDNFQSKWARYGFETACDYFRSEKIDKLEECLKIAIERLERISNFEPWDTQKNPGCGSSCESQSGYKSVIAHDALAEIRKMRGEE